MFAKLILLALCANFIHAQQNVTQPPIPETTIAVSLIKPNASSAADTKLLVNHTDNSQGVQRILNSHPVEAVIGESSSSAAVSGASNFTTLVILISLIVVACIAAAIISAIFIMKRRFSSWRINSSKAGAETGEDAENGDAKCTEVNEKEAEVKKEATVETTNEQAPVETVEAKQDAVVSAEAPVVAEVVEKTQELTTQVVVEQVEQPQASPSSESPLIEEQPQAQTVVAEQPAVVVEAGVEPAVVNANTQSSTSLIANVLSELSESVASKLQTDPEKQPLNHE
jgi:flagellar basal body-associated protein FliL